MLIFFSIILLRILFAFCCGQIYNIFYILVPYRLTQILKSGNLFSRPIIRGKVGEKKNMEKKLQWIPGFLSLHSLFVVCG
jgi:hypothetical protein